MNGLIDRYLNPPDQATLGRAVWLVGCQGGGDMLKAIVIVVGATTVAVVLSFRESELSPSGDVAEIVEIPLPM